MSKRKVYSMTKRGPASISQKIAWQEQRDDMAEMSTDPQKRIRNGLEKEKPMIKQDPAQERSKTYIMKAQRLIHATRCQ